MSDSSINYAMSESAPKPAPTAAIELAAAHGEREGASDYHGRASDVAAGLQSADWAWPMTSADEAYINAVGVDEICRAIGIDSSQWDEVSSAWLVAFSRGYRLAHASTAGPQRNESGSTPSEKHSPVSGHSLATRTA
jgi:hypothetical protein